jgi:hypothetical protein
MRFLAFARAAAALFVLSLLGPCLAPASADALPGETVISLTFDDGIKSQADLAAPVLASHGMNGTFYINSGNVGANSYYMTWSQVDGLRRGRQRDRRPPRSRTRGSRPSQPTSSDSRSATTPRRFGTAATR